MRWIVKGIALISLVMLPSLASATSQQAWDAAMELARQGSDRQAVAMLHGAALQEEADSSWAQRFEIASQMLELRAKARYRNEYQSLAPMPNNQYAMLMGNWLRQHPLPKAEGSSIPGVLASIIPGSGHAWMGRWGDAGVSAMLVWPLLILTFWAARREMGPVTVFFALITAWLWSGTVFSAVSLAERGDFELYYGWWQQMWNASGLPSKPW